MAQGYETHRRREALPATFEIVYGHAWKTAAKRAADGRQIIDFQPRGAR
jgi:malonyl-CoA O-methyltransferase